MQAHHSAACQRRAALTAVHGDTHAAATRRDLGVAALLLHQAGRQHGSTGAMLSSRRDASGCAWQKHTNKREAATSTRQRAEYLQTVLLQTWTNPKTCLLLRQHPLQLLNEFSMKQTVQLSMSKLKQTTAW